MLCRQIKQLHMCHTARHALPAAAGITSAHAETARTTLLLLHESCPLTASAGLSNGLGNCLGLAGG
jgi:hypothetical protein